MAIIWYKTRIIGYLILETLKAIQNRNSVAHLAEPAPSIEEMKQVYKGALRAPDHAWLRPWQFIEIRGNARKRLSDSFIKASISSLKVHWKTYINWARWGVVMRSYLVFWPFMNTRFTIVIFKALGFLRWLIYICISRTTRIIEDISFISISDFTN